MAMADEKQIARATMQSLFRDVNERIEEEAVGREVESELLCECVDPECVTTIRLTHDEYEAVRGTPTRFFVVPGHDVAALESVIGGNGRYVVVEKLGKGREAAVRLDPRRRSPEPSQLALP